jgi:hypothetical protein
MWGIGNDADNYIDRSHNLFPILKLIHLLKNKIKKRGLGGSIRPVPHTGFPRMLQALFAGRLHWERTGRGERSGCSRKSWHMPSAVLAEVCLPQLEHRAFSRLGLQAFLP